MVVQAVPVDVQAGRPFFQGGMYWPYEGLWRRCWHEKPCVPPSFCYQKMKLYKMCRLNLKAFVGPGEASGYYFVF